LTFNLSFGNNLCFSCSNGSYKTTSNIFVPWPFQWYKELFNPMNFGLCNRLLKIWKCTRTPTPKMGVHLKVWGFIPLHSFALPRAWDVNPRLLSWPTPLQALAFVASLRLGLWQPLTCSNFRFKLMKLLILECYKMEWWMYNCCYSISWSYISIE
jgi:hypothetical protein